MRRTCACPTSFGPTGRIQPWSSDTLSLSAKNHRLKKAGSSRRDCPDSGDAGLPRPWRVSKFRRKRGATSRPVSYLLSPRQPLALRLVLVAPRRRSPALCNPALSLGSVNPTEAQGSRAPRRDLSALLHAEAPFVEGSQGRTSSFASLIARVAAQPSFWEKRSRVGRRGIAPGGARPVASRPRCKGHLTLSKD